ncbi:sensor histidine kinase [Pedobacter arcticus]|uniref:sensor histidine kinase n=1 Tax=Pedobacter arcticus TaxID=752140 RepID=UPI0002E8CF04|nr:PAS domain-containing sensor histidine kinase [Pedobacter arcticus]
MRSLNLASFKTDEFTLLSQFFYHTPDLLCIASFEGYFLKINPSVSRVLGYSEEELLSIAITDLIFEEDKAITRLTRNQMLEGVPLINFENRYKTKTGEIVWLSWTSIPVYENRYIFAIAKNVTKRKEAEKQQKLLFEEVSRINKDLEHFVRLASHNLRSPLANIRGLFDLLNYDEIENQDNLKLINLIKQSTDKVNETLENYINELVQKDVNAKLHIENLSIETCLRDVCESVSAIIRNSNAIIDSDFTAFNEIVFNKSYFESILLNLLTNALKYRKPKIAPHIVFKTLINGNLHQLIVSDNGIGFDADKAKDRIFGLNQTFHTNTDAKGVGLFLVKKQVTEMGGSVVVESKKNIGTTFTITFKP